MRKISLFIAILVAFVLLPLVAGAQRYGEFTAITAATATSTQTSALIVKPQGAKGMIVIIDVTAGTSLLLDMQVAMYSPGLAATTLWTQVCPTADGITGVSETTCVYYPIAQSNGAGGLDEDFIIALPNQFAIVVTHGDTDAATYVVYYQWLY